MVWTLECILPCANDSSTFSPEAHVRTDAEGGCETVHSLVVLPAQVEEDPQATLHIGVNGCGVQAHSCQEEFLHFQKQGAKQEIKESTVFPGVTSFTHILVYSSVSAQHCTAGR